MASARVLTTTRRQSFEASASNDLDLLFLSFGGPLLYGQPGQQPLTVCNDIVNYVYNGQIVFGVGAEISWLSDGEKAPTTSLKMQNIDGVIGTFLQRLARSPRLTLMILSGNDWQTTLTDTGEVDALGNEILARYPIGTPNVDDTADYLRILSVTGDVSEVSCQLGSWDLSLEPFPAIRTTQDRLPALYR